MSSRYNCNWRIDWDTCNVIYEKIPFNIMPLNYLISPLPILFCLNRVSQILYEPSFDPVIIKSIEATKIRLMSY